MVLEELRYDLNILISLVSSNCSSVNGIRVCVIKIFVKALNIFMVQIMTSVYLCHTDIWGSPHSHSDLLEIQEPIK